MAISALLSTCAASAPSPRWAQSRLWLQSFSLRTPRTRPVGCAKRSPGSRDNHTERQWTSGPSVSFSRSSLWGHRPRLELRPSNRPRSYSSRGRNLSFKQLTRSARSSSWRCAFKLTWISVRQVSGPVQSLAGALRAGLDPSNLARSLPNSNLMRRSCLHALNSPRIGRLQPPSSMSIRG